MTPQSVSKPYARTSRDHGRLRNFATIFGKLGVPRPLTGSQPAAALNPPVPQPGFEPFVMSLKISGAE